MGAFSIFTSKKRKAKLSLPTINEYYEKAAKRVYYLKLACLFALVCFVAFSFTFYSNELTMENFRYMLKFMSLSTGETVADGSEIRYESDEFTKYIPVNGDIAVVSGQGVQIYDAAGRKLLRHQMQLNNPICAENGRHLIVADRNGYTVNIFSAYSLLYTQTYKSPVLSVAACPNGNYAVVTSESGYKSVVLIYDREFRLVFEKKFAERYTFCIDLSDNGQYILMGTLTNNQEGELVTAMLKYDINISATDAMYTGQFGEEIPWECRLFPDGRMLFVTNTTIRIYEADNTCSTTFVFREENTALKVFEASDKYLLLGFESEGLSNATRLNIYSHDGNLISSKNLVNDIGHIDIIDNFAYVYSINKLYRYSLDGNAEDTEREVGLDYISLSQDSENERIIVFYSNKAVIYTKENFE